jgi:hypothetical protein
LAGNVASFNANQNASIYNTAATNNAAIDAAKITSGATNNAGWMALLGGVSQGAGSAAGGYLSNAEFSDRRMKKDIKPLGKGGPGGRCYRRITLCCSSSGIPDDRC